MGITAATIADRDAVIALWRACSLTRDWNDPHDDFDLAMANPTSTILLAREGGGIIGTVMVGFDGHRGWVYYLGVDPAARRGGTGRALMAAAEAWLAGRGAPKVQLMIREGNTAALAFYAALGFAPQPLAMMDKMLGAEQP